MDTEEEIKEMENAEQIGTVEIFLEPQRRVKTAYAKTPRKKRKKKTYPAGNKPSDRCITPMHVIDLCTSSLGISRISLDVCTEADNPLNAEYFYTFEDDGLAQPWAIFDDAIIEGDKPFLWCNPPYSTGQKIRWLNKLALEMPALTAQGVSVAFLLPADTTSNWYKLAESLLLYETRFDRRIKFGVPYMELDGPPGGAGFATNLLTNFPVKSDRCFIVTKAGERAFLNEEQQEDK